MKYCYSLLEGSHLESKLTALTEGQSPCNDLFNQIKETRMDISLDTSNVLLV